MLSILGHVALWACAALALAFAVACLVPLRDQLRGGYYGDGWLFAIGGVLLGLLSACFAVFLAGVALGKFEFESDPCDYTVMAGKTPIVMEHDGWIKSGGRDVWCGPGPVPSGEPR